MSTSVIVGTIVSLGIRIGICMFGLNTTSPDCTVDVSGIACEAETVISEATCFIFVTVLVILLISLTDTGCSKGLITISVGTESVLSESV